MSEKQKKPKTPSLDDYIKTRENGDINLESPCIRYFQDIIIAIKGRENKIKAWNTLVRLNRSLNMLEDNKEKLQIVKDTLAKDFPYLADIPICDKLKSHPKEICSFNDLFKLVKKHDPQSIPELLNRANGYLKLTGLSPASIDFIVYALLNDLASRPLFGYLAEYQVCEKLQNQIRLKFNTVGVIH